MSDSKWVSNEPCPQCREIGRDSTGNHLGIYSDGHGYCKVHGYCAKPIVKNILKGSDRSMEFKLNSDNNNSWGVPTSDTSSIPKDTLSKYSPLPLSPTTAHRGLTQDTLRFYEIKTRVTASGQPVSVLLPYGGSTLVRSWDRKAFHWEGYAKDAQLFGMDKFSAGQARSITICESAYDAMSVYQMLGSKYPTVAVGSASTARGDCERHRAYINAFERIYLCFDGDKPGTDAAQDVSKLFDTNKVYQVKLTKHKDANEYLVANPASQDDAKAFVSVWYNSRPFLPRGIINSYEDVEKVLSTEEAGSVATYPFPTLEDMTYGIRWGEVNLITAQEKIGKTEFIRAIEYHLLKTTDDNVGIIHLEEGEKRATQGLIGYELGSPVHLPDAGVSVDDQVLAYKELTRRDGRLHYYAHFGSDDPNTILDVIRYLATVCHCKYIFLDHITMLVTGFEDEDERKKLDYLSTRLAMLTRELNFTLFLVSHVNDDGKTRGSRNISKVADLIIHLDRDIEGPTLDSRTTTRLTIKGNRFAGRTGPAGYLSFNPKTFRLKELELENSNDIDLS